MAIKNTNATIVAFKRETSFKEVLSFTNADVVSFDTFSFTPQTESLDRQYVNANSLLSGVAVQGSQTSSGSISIEVVPDSADSTKLAGHLLYESVLGAYNGAGAEITATDIEDKRETSDGTAGVYYLSNGNEDLQTLGIKYVIGGDEASSVDIRGVAATQWKVSFPSQGIVKSEFSLGGSTGFIPVSQDTPLDPLCSSMTPYVAKSNVLTIGGVSICATDINLTFTAETQDIKCITDSGISSKALTSRKIEGSMTLIFENIDEINAYNSWGTTNLFISATNAEGKTFAIKLNKIQKTSLDLADDNSVITQSVNFEAYDTCDGSSTAVLIASK